MSKTNITILELVILEGNYKNNVGSRECARRMKIGKDKVYFYYKQFEQGLTVKEIYKNYLKNRSRCGRKKIPFSEERVTYIKEKLLVDGWSLDEIAGREKLENKEDSCSTSTLYRRADDGTIDEKWLLRKGKIKWKIRADKTGGVEKVNTIHDRNRKYPEVLNNLVFGHFEGDTIVGKDHASSIITLDERVSRFRILLTGSHKSEDVASSITKWGTSFSN